MSYTRKKKKKKLDESYLERIFSLVIIILAISLSALAQELYTCLKSFKKTTREKLFALMVNYLENLGCVHFECHQSVI